MVFVLQQFNYICRKKNSLFVKIQGDSDNYDIVESEYDKQIALSPSGLREGIKSKTY